MLAVLDLGIANTLINLIAEAHAGEDQEKAAHFYVTSFWVTTCVVILLSPLLYMFWRMANWAAIFHLTDPSQIQHAAKCVLIAAAFALFSLPLTLANKVLAGYQQVHIANYFAMAGSMFTLIAILSTIATHGTIVQLMASYCTALLLGTLALNLWLWFWQKRWLKPTFRSVRSRVVRRIFAQGLLFFIIQCTGLVVFSSDNLVIAHYLGPEKVTPYSFAWRLTSYTAMVQALILPSLWPALSDAYHKRQLNWVRSTYRAVARNSLIAVGIGALLVGLTGQVVIRIWAGPDAVPSRVLLWLMAFFNVVMAATTNQAFLLNATGRIRLEATLAVLAAAANLGLSIFFVQRIGVEGVILSSILSFLLFMIVPQHFETERVLKGSYLSAERHYDLSD